MSDIIAIFAEKFVFTFAFIIPTIYLKQYCLQKYIFFLDKQENLKKKLKKKYYSAQNHEKRQKKPIILLIIGFFIYLKSLIQVCPLIRLLPRKEFQPILLCEVSR